MQGQSPDNDNGVNATPLSEGAASSQSSVGASAGASVGASPQASTAHLLPDWAQSNLIAALALTTAGICAFASTWFLMSPAVETSGRTILISMVVANVVIAAGFGLLVGARLWHVWSNRRNQLAGSRMHMQLVWLFSLVAVIPAVIAFVFAFTILRSSLNDVFSERTENYHQTARDIANELVEANRQGILGEMLRVATDIHRSEIQNIGLERSPINFRQYLEIQTRARSFDALFLMGSDRRMLAQIELTDGTYTLPEKLVFDNIDSAYAQETSDSPIRASAHSFGANNVNELDRWRGVLKLPDYGGGYLVVYKPIPSAIAQRMKQVRLMAADWREAVTGRRRLERVFTVGYVLLAVTILFGAIWLALGAATRIVSPIGRLVEMADKVSGGDLAARVSVYKNDGEIGELAKSMNRMTSQLQTQRSDLIDTNKQFDKRRRFTEAVLSGVSAGVLGVDTRGHVTIANRSAASLLGIKATKITGQPLAKLVPEIEPLFEDAILSPGEAVGGQVDFIRNGRTQTFNVQIVRDQADGERSFVVTLDDITQLIAAQRNAAWGDVARRIAHEIKNPLTPIQLSAERLRRKYLGEVKTSPEVFDKCTDTIIRQVNDIGRMVDEFSSFARMPKPVIDNEDIRELVKSAVFPQRVTYPDISFDTDMPSEAITVSCDGRLMVQAFTNLIKNAAESISTRLAQDEFDDKESSVVPGKVLIKVKSDDFQNVRIEIMDNGIGLPKAERHRMAEPYMTTREKGTGLGLAIVKKVTEEHGGTLVFDDDKTLGKAGARMTITLPLSTEKNLDNTQAQLSITAAE